MGEYSNQYRSVYNNTECISCDRPLSQYGWGRDGKAYGCRGLCKACYESFRRHGVVKKRLPRERECNNCGDVRTIKAYGLCTKCYQKKDKPNATESLRYGSVIHSNVLQPVKINVPKMTNKQFRHKYKKLLSPFIMLNEYHSQKDKLHLQHIECGKTFYKNPGHFVSGQGCPYCSAKTSVGEQQLVDFLVSIGIKNIIRNDRSILDGKELDVYLPDYNIAIEYDGLFFHSVDMLERKIGRADAINYHVNKTIECNKKNIRLIHIFEDEWQYNRNIVKDKLMSIFRIGDIDRIFARKCSVLIIKNPKSFMDDNHIQGGTMSSVYIGLFLDNELVAVQAFNKPRLGIGFDKSDGTYELSRYVTKNRTLVVGGFSKCLKFFIDKYNPSNIYSYADLRWVDKTNNVYIRNGFKLSHINRPNYWYIIGKMRYHRFNFRKNSIKNKFPETYDNSKTERQMMTDLGYRRIYDCGTAHFFFSQSK